MADLDLRMPPGVYFEIAGTRSYVIPAEQPKRNPNKLRDNCLQQIELIKRLSTRKSKARKLFRRKVQMAKALPLGMHGIMWDNDFIPLEVAEGVVAFFNDPNWFKRLREAGIR